MTERLLLTVSQAAEALCLNRATVYVLINRGDLESVKIGSSRRIPREALEEFVRRLRQEGNAEPRTS